MTSGSVLDLINLYQPSVMKLAKEGNPQAIALWVNTHLVPQGIYARVEVEQPGHYLIAVEFQREPERSRLVRFLCHRLHRLESTAIHQVRIVAQPVGSTEIRWQQAVRLIAAPGSPVSRPAPPQPKPAPPPLLNPTPAVEKVETVEEFDDGPTWSLPTWSQPRWLRQLFQPNLSRPLGAPLKYGRPLLIGAAIAVALGGAVKAISYHTDWLEYGLAATLRPFDANPPKAWVKGAFGEVPVRESASVSDSPWAILVFSTDAVLEGDSATASEAETQPEYMAAFREADLALTSINRPIMDDRTADQNSIPLDRLRAIGVDLVTVGVDKTGQVIGRGISQTLKTLRQVDIRPVGLGRSHREARRPEIFEVRGQRIAYLSYSDASIEMERPSQGAAVIEREMLQDIQAIRSEVQWVVINFRWGHELAEYPSDWQMQLSRFAVDHGADLVVGQHASVMQGAEIYKGRAIAYSLGDLIFADTETANENYESVILKVSLQEDQMRLEFLPVQVRNRQPRIVSGEAGEAILRYIQQASALFREPLQAPVLLKGQTIERPDALLGTPSTEPTTEASPEESLEPEPSEPEAESFISYPEDGSSAEETPEEEPVYSAEDESDAYDSADDSFIDE